MVAIAFLIPLAIVVRDVARDQAFTTAQLTGAAIEPVLAVTTSRATIERAIASTPAGAAGRLAVYLTARGQRAGVGVGGPQHASGAQLRAAVADARSFIAPVTGGYVVLQPVALSEGRLAVIEVYVPAADAAHGVTASWAVMTAVAVALIAVSVLVADRLATRVTRPARELAAAASRARRRRPRRPQLARRPGGAGGGGAGVQRDGGAAGQADRGRARAGR